MCTVYRKTKLYELRKFSGVVTMRNNTSTPHERAQAVIDVKSSDLAGKWGVAQVRQRLANQGVRISRYTVILVPILNLHTF